ncbi:NAD(P)H-binding protein [Streptomyces sp. RB6PN25]|uniref:NAD(P)H-binding protein n=1 Tax=Streptomyces humicola TaxID=2953240 RepID=A0ABT1Q6G4_9ACTN|nr:NAD(P)H-binding protein [Streptomyces humicola]MCQ4084983.1 NAD(P)H-binding protein [Streptomyces humicola]
MKILLFGATGMIGSRIAAEVLRRGHEITAATRSGKAPGLDDAKAAVVSADVSDAGKVAELATGHDAVVSAIAPPRDGSEPSGPLLAAYRALIEGLRSSGVRRVVVVGGAGSLQVAPGQALVDSPGFPDAYKGEALAHREVLTLFRGVDDLDWTYLSPAAEIAPGERTGVFRTGGDQLLADAEGHSRISAEDYAVALVDEVEKGEAVHRRITVAY